MKNNKFKNSQRDLLQKVKFRTPGGILWLKRWKNGYMHESTAKTIVIIEKEDGSVITVPKESKYYKIID